MWSLCPKGAAIKTRVHLIQVLNALLHVNAEKLVGEARNVTLFLAMSVHPSPNHRPIESGSIDTLSAPDACCQMLCSIFELLVASSWHINLHPSSLHAQSCGCDQEVRGSRDLNALSCRQHTHGRVVGDPTELATRCS